MAVLEPLINQKSAILDAGFSLFNVNGFAKNPRSIPGASSWDYRFALKVAPNNVN